MLRCMHARAQAAAAVADACCPAAAAHAQELPQLRVLRLDSSRLPCPQPFAGLFGGLCTSLAVLAVNACCLSSLEGLGLLQQLRELYAAGNQLADLAPLAGASAMGRAGRQQDGIRSAGRVRRAVPATAVAAGP